MDPTSPPIPSSGDDRNADRDDLVRDNPECDRDHDNSNGNEPMAGADEARSLADASLVIRRLPLGNVLRKAAKHDAPDAEGRPLCEHPDAAAVLDECRRRQPGCARYADSTIMEAYLGLLQDRLCGIRVTERFAREHPEVARQAIADIAAVLPHTHPGERLLIWHELRTRYVEQPGCPLDQDEKIRRAWRNVRMAQRRVDCAGVASRHSHEKQTRRRAMRLLGKKLNWTEELLEQLPLESFDPSSSTVRIPACMDDAPTPLPDECVAAMKRWLKARGGGEGKLFVAARARCACETRNPAIGPLDHVVGADLDDDAARLPAEDTILLLNRVLGERDRRYLWEVVQSSGPWTESLIATLQSQVICDGSGPWMSGRELTKQERNKSYMAVRLALARLLARQEHPRLRSSPMRRPMS